MGTHDHEHTWERRESTFSTHFIDEPNSRRRSLYVVKVRCAACGQSGFRYPPSRVVLTWDRDPVNWLTEL